MALFEVGTTKGMDISIEWKSIEENLHPGEGPHLKLWD